MGFFSFQFKVGSGFFFQLSRIRVRGKMYLGSSSLNFLHSRKLKNHAYTLFKNNQSSSDCKTKTRPNCKTYELDPNYMWLQFSFGSIFLGFKLGAHAELVVGRRGVLAVRDAMLLLLL